MENAANKPFLVEMATRGSLLRMKDSKAMEDPFNRDPFRGMKLLASQVLSWRKREGNPSLRPTLLPEENRMPRVPSKAQERMLQVLEETENQGSTYREVLQQRGMLTSEGLLNRDQIFPLT